MNTIHILMHNNWKMFIAFVERSLGGACRYTESRRHKHISKNKITSSDALIPTTTIIVFNNIYVAHIIVWYFKRQYMLYRQIIKQNLPEKKNYQNKLIPIKCKKGGNVI